MTIIRMYIVLQNIVMVRLFLITVLTLICTIVLAQNSQSKSVLSQYEEFRCMAHKKYDDFREKANMQYAEFMRQAWQTYNASSAVPRPKDEIVPPVVMLDKDSRVPLQESRPVPIREVVKPPVFVPQPIPIAPIREVPAVGEERVAFRFYGTDVKVRFGEDCRFRLSALTNDVLSAAWKKMAGDVYNNLLRDCLELRIRMELSDWAYLSLLQTMAEACMGKGNEAVMLTAYVYCQSGYKMRIGRSDGRLVLLYGCDYTIYDRPYFDIGGTRYYPTDNNVRRMEICDVAFPKEQVLSLQMRRQPKLARVETPVRILRSKRYPELQVEVSVNRNLNDYYENYPTSETGHDFMTRWAIYANVPMDEGVVNMLYPPLRERLADLDKKEAVERLLNLVQTAFVYEYDEKVWGHDRAFFAEETLSYPYCDCEDRSILFSRLVRDLLGLDVVLVYYPGHLATAVCFSDGNVAGDYIDISGRRFTVCDPTYIGAGVGRTMPDMDNQAARVILLDR